MELERAAFLRTAMLKSLRSVNPLILTYWAGIISLFLGLTINAGIGTALTWVGGIVALESAITSYLAATLSRRD